jgi:hypothetical protein
MRWFRVTMSTMSASDAAPLPRLGEVFFDVRGSARSMRLSWYADTGVAVFSIWQAGTCTGTFRLPMGDLPRMIETLRRGPGGRLPRDQDAAPRHDDPDYRWENDSAEYQPDDVIAAGQYDDMAAAGQYDATTAARQYHETTAARQYHETTAAQYDDGAAPQYPGGRAAGAYPAAGSVAFSGERTRAHYLPESAGPRHGRDPAGRGAVPGAHNGGSVPRQDEQGRPPESFPYGSSAGYEAAYEAAPGLGGEPDFPLA